MGKKKEIQKKIVMKMKRKGFRLTRGKMGKVKVTLTITEMGVF